MRSIPSALQAKLDSGVTTLCRCWIITRNDGVTQGFTEHDEDVVLGDVTCRAGTVAVVLHFHGEPGIAAAGKRKLAAGEPAVVESL